MHTHRPCMTVRGSRTGTGAQQLGACGCGCCGPASMSTRSRLGMKAGMGKSRTVRHRIPNIPPVSRIGGKNRNRKLTEKYGQERERKWLRRFPARIFGFPYRAGKIPAGIPVPLPHFGPFLPISAAQPNSAPRAQRAPKFGSAPRSPAPQTLKAPNFSPFPPHISRPPPHTLSESQSLSLSHRPRSRTLARRSPRSPAPPSGRPPAVPLSPYIKI